MNCRRSCAAGCGRCHRRRCRRPVHHHHVLLLVLHYIVRVFCLLLLPDAKGDDANCACQPAADRDVSTAARCLPPTGLSADPLFAARAPLFCFVFIRFLRDLQFLFKELFIWGIRVHHESRVGVCSGIQISNAVHSFHRSL